MASTVHPENEPFLDHLLREVRRLPIDVALDTELTADAVAGLSPDAVIIATGGRIVEPRIEGDDLPHVLTGSLLRSLLGGEVPPNAAGKLPVWQRSGVRSLGRPLQRWLRPSLLRRATRIWMPLGQRVTIVGADLAALELAEFLAERGRHVSVLEPADEIAPEIGLKRRDEHMLRLDRCKVAVNTGIHIDRITSSGVVLLSHTGGEKLVPADSVIVVGGIQPDTALYDALRERIPEVYAVGDCTGLGLIRKATLEGARAACAL
jgi:2,4-dienoyl-CoA reductase (NADPH2)